MNSDLASAKNDTSGQFVPDQDQGRLIEAEHVSRYQWASQAAKARRVLDAGCGTGYGSRLLADGGAREVIGVDIAGSVLEAAADGMPGSVRLQAGDVRKLDFEDDTFELVVCFEVIERLEDPLIALDELVRVLAPGGLLLISIPERGVDAAGNSRHLHEFSPAELDTELASRLRNVRLVRQRDYVVSAVLSDTAASQGNGAGVNDLVIRKGITDAPGDEVFAIAMASDADIPDVRGLATTTGTLELGEWLSAFEMQSRAIAEKDSHIDELTARLEERDRLARLLGDAETRLAEVPALNLRIADLEFELAEALSVAEKARREAAELDRALIYGRRMLRYVRPFIKPLRRLRRKLRG